MWLQSARALIFDGSAQNLNRTSVGYLRGYLDGFDGRFFEQPYDRHSPLRFTAADLLAVTALSVVVPSDAAFWILRNEGPDSAQSLLAKIDSDHHIEDLSSEEFKVHLGEHSAAWELWDLLIQQPGIGSTIAGKLLAAKRPYLIPISDSYVKHILGTDERHLWICMWTVLNVTSRTSVFEGGPQFDKQRNSFRHCRGSWSLAVPGSRRTGLLISITRDALSNRLKDPTKRFELSDSHRLALRPRLFRHRYLRPQIDPEVIGLLSNAHSSHSRDRRH
jgi:hypothetical protein